MIPRKTRRIIPTGLRCKSIADTAGSILFTKKLSKGGERFG
jgi:hypothetical protein